MNLRDYVITPQDRASPKKRHNLQLQKIFAKKDAEKENPRNLLNHIDRFSYAALEGAKSTFFKASDKQEIFYVVRGKGEILSKEQKGEIETGYAFIIPPNIKYMLTNLNPKTSLEMLVITEQTPQNPSDQITIKNTDEIPFDKFDPPLHWCHSSQTIFSYEKDNLSNVHYVSLVYIEPEQLPEPHAHFPGHDEVWHSLQGKTRMAFKNNHFEQAPGTSIFIPDDGKTEHSSITMKEKAIFFFFMHHMALENRILVLGSNGRIGRILVNYLKNEKGYQFLAGIDRDYDRNPVDILQDDIWHYFRNIETVIHLAANPNPSIDETEANKNIEITKKLIKACKRHKPKRIIYASSINVYPYRDIGRITKDTPLTPNTAFNKGGYYGKSKIECERMLEQYCRANNISLLNLRFGWVTSNDKHPPYAEDKPHSRDLEAALKHEDLFKIIDKAIWYEGIGSYVCVSEQCKFIDRELLFPF